MDIKLFYYRFKNRFLPFLSKNGEFNYILEKQGIKVGKGTIFFGPHTMSIDRTRPYLLEIGEYCKITSGTIILTHDYSRSVLRRVYGEILGEGAKTIIGDNVFIGMNSIILMGTHIGNNVVVGAGSVVRGSIPDNVVIGGNPAKIICTLDEFYKKRKAQVLPSAIEWISAFYDHFKRYPDIRETDAYWPLFMERNEKTVLDSGVFVRLNGDCYEEIMRDFLKVNQCLTTTRISYNIV